MVSSSRIADLIFPKEFPANLGHAVGLITSRTGQQHLELRLALGWDKCDWFCYQVCKHDVMVLERSVFMILSRSLIYGG